MREEDKNGITNDLRELLKQLKEIDAKMDTMLYGGAR